jgi:chitin synthase
VAVKEVNKKPIIAYLYKYTTKVGIKLRKGIIETKPSIGYLV